MFSPLRARAAVLPGAPACLNVPRLVRTPLRGLRAGRLFAGGRLDDLGRLPRYGGALLVGATLIWAPILGYLENAPPRFTSQMVLILPGSGASASVSLESIGQASSHASSPFAHNSVSPTVTYKRLIGADRIVARSAEALGLPRHAVSAPQVELIDQTGLIRVSVTGPSAQAAQAQGAALLAAFFAELDYLRQDEMTTREASGGGAIAEYRRSVAETRAEIERLQRESGLDSAEQYRARVAETDALRGRLDDLQVQLAERTEAVTALQTALAVSPRLAAATLKLHADSAFMEIAGRMAGAAAELAAARGAFGENHPEVGAARAALEAARAASLGRAAALTALSPDEIAGLDLAPVGGRAELLARLVQLDTERAAMASEVAAMAARLAENAARNRALAHSAARLEDLQRDFLVAEAVFASAMARAQTTKADVYASYPLVQVLEDPTLPDAPSSPRRKLALLAGAAATVMLAVGFMLGWVRRPLIARILVERGRE